MCTLERKPSPSKRKAATRTAYYYKKASVPHTKPRRYRGQYFVRCRRERRLIRILMSSPPNNCIIEPRERTIVRRVYYRILPRLLSLVVYPPDRADILTLERCYYDYLNISRLRSGVNRRANRLSWLTRNMPYRSRVSLEPSRCLKYQTIRPKDAMSPSGDPIITAQRLSTPAP